MDVYANLYADFDGLGRSEKPLGGRFWGPFLVIASPFQSKMNAMLWPRLRAIGHAYLLSIAFWCGLALLMGLQFQPFNRHDPWGWLAAFATQVAFRGLPLAFWAPPIFYLVGRFLHYSKKRFRYALVWLLGAAPFVVLHLTMVWLLPSFDTSLQGFVPHTYAYWREMIRTNFADEAFIYVAIVVAGHAYQYMKRLQREERERAEYQQALAASELQALKMQLHPHFLFNTLHGIATLIESDARSAKIMVIKLSNLLRTALDRGKADLIPLEDELKFVREYLDLEKMRFGNRLAIEWLIADEACGLLVPQMILQPLAENAIRHGIAASREAGRIEVAAAMKDGILEILVRNTGAGKGTNGTGVGLRNVESRLQYLYSGDADVKLTVSEDHVATVRLTVPALRSQGGSTQKAA